MLFNKIRATEWWHVESANLAGAGYIAAVCQHHIKITPFQQDTKILFESTYLAGAGYI